MTSRFNKRFNDLTNEQDELLSKLSEECAEVIQAIEKIRQHGYMSHHPDRPDQTNRLDLTKELGDLTCVIQLLVKSRDIHEVMIHRFALEKFSKMQAYSHHIDWSKYK